MKIAIYPGSFDPITLGHMDIIRRAAQCFDQVYVCVLINCDKKPMFSADERVDMIRRSVADLPNVTAEHYSGLLAAYARGWRRIPLLSLLYCCAAYTWLLAGVGLFLARRGQWRRLAAFLPALLSLGVCMLSPVNDYFRYFLPIVAMTFPLTGFAMRRGEK